MVPSVRQAEGWEGFYGQGGGGSELRWGSSILCQLITFFYGFTKRVRARGSGRRESELNGPIFQVRTSELWYAILLPWQDIK